MAESVVMSSNFVATCLDSSEVVLGVWAEPIKQPWSLEETARISTRSSFLRIEEFDPSLVLLGIRLQAICLVLCVISMLLDE
ncbi:hypothetical protein Nepgr_020105 [Nepenthes gracilis]|uniref:Uncharacterized protein n=1 Tax=Nepenthes gracilis TaxID=150966 RepID=A0AAD3SWD9_NEPGR|nr:hypothetical protein Nepgr_020105 [Nepenthes gracilis]